MEKSKVARMLLVSSFAFMGTGCMQQMAENKVNDKLRDHQRNALTCLDTEGTTARAVNQFYLYRPQIPNYKNLQAMQNQLGEVSQAAAAFSTNDKVRHCYVGYRIVQKWGRPESLFFAFYKESQDVGDCNRRSHFEIEDQVATIHGADLSRDGRQIADCHRVNDN